MYCAQWWIVANRQILCTDMSTTVQRLRVIMHSPYVILATGMNLAQIWVSFQYGARPTDNGKLFRLAFV